MRKAYLDNIRWMTVVIVVIYHVLYMYNGEGILGGLGKITDLPVQHYDLFLYVVYPWLMPILFIVSGICAKHDLDRHTGKEFIAKRTRKLLVPSTIGLFVFQFISGYFNMSLGNAFDNMGEVPTVIQYFIMVLSGTGPLWYMQMLWLFSILLFEIKRIENNHLWEVGKKTNLITLILLCIPVWISSLLLNTPVVVVYRFGLYLTMFLLGYYVFSHDEVIDILKRWFTLFLGIASILGIIFCMRYFGENYADAPINRTPLYIAYCWFGCLAILGGMAKHGNITNSFTQHMNKHSFGLYVFHYLGMTMVAVLIAKPKLLPAPAIYLLTLVAGVASGYLFYEVISRLPFFRWAVLGIKKKG